MYICIKNTFVQVVQWKSNTVDGKNIYITEGAFIDVNESLLIVRDYQKGAHLSTSWSKHCVE